MSLFVIVAVIYFLGMMLMSGGLFTLFGIVGLVYVAQALYEDFRYKPEDDEDADTVTVADSQGPQPNSERPDGGVAPLDVDDELVIDAHTQSPRGNTRATKADFTESRGADDFSYDTDIG